VINTLVYNTAVLFRDHKQGTLTKEEGSVQLTSLLG
jgi:hypothetical protein